jgi:hypothetical protein
MKRVCSSTVVIEAQLSALAVAYKDAQRSLSTARTPRAPPSTMTPTKGSSLGNDRSAQRTPFIFSSPTFPSQPVSVPLQAAGPSASLDGGSLTLTVQTPLTKGGFRRQLAHMSLNDDPSSPVHRGEGPEQEKGSLQLLLGAAGLSDGDLKVCRALQANQSGRQCVVSTLRAFIHLVRTAPSQYS